MDNFVNLHLHSDHSALDGIIRLPELMTRVKELEQPAVGLSDHGTIAGTYELFTSAKVTGTKVVPGIEAYVDDVLLDREDKERTYYHMCIWAPTQESLGDLVHMSSAAWRYNFFYKPRLNREMIKDRGKNLIATSGCLSGQFAKLVLEGDFVAAERVIEFLRRNFRQVYMEIQATIPKEEGAEVYAHQKIVNNYAIQIAKGLGIPLLACNDSHYLLDTDADAHATWLALQSRKAIDDPRRFKFDVTGVHCRTRDEMFEAFRTWYPDISSKDVEESINNSVQIAEDTNLTGYKVYTSLTPKLLPEDQAFERLRAIAEEGYRQLITEDSYRKYAERKRIEITDAEQVYKDRFAYELQQIQTQGFVDYFLLVHELLDWCEQNGIYRGAGRGSAASSLISYCTGITKAIDPLAYDLVFERFIAPARIYNPDIDLDFAAAQREQVIDHLFERWGRKNVSMIGTMVKEKGKLVIGDIGRAYHIPYADLARVKDVVIQRPTGDARASDTLTETFELFTEAKQFNDRYPYVLPIAVRLEGCVRGFGQHAAGILITPDKLENYVPIERRKDVMTCAFDGLAVEKMGFLKIDILGIDVLDLLKDVHDLVKETRGVDVDYWNLPLDDKETLDAFSRADLLGVFQFQKSVGMENICRAAPITQFLDVAHLNALYRPGGMRSGAAIEYLNNRAGRSEPEKVHPVYDEITAPTYGIIIYQEQIMQMFARLAGFPATRVDEGRKLIAKSHGVEAFDKLYPEFLDGCLKNDISEPLAKTFFGKMRHSGSYSFNLAHSVAYTMLSYYSQYMKVHYPQEFWTCFLNREEDTELIKAAIRRWINDFGGFVPLDINRSGMGFVIDGDQIRAGINKLKWCSPVSWGEITSKRPFASYEDFEARVTKRVVNARVKRNLLISGAFDAMLPEHEILIKLGMTKLEREIASAEIYPSFTGANALDAYRDIIDTIAETNKLTSISSLRQGHTGLFQSIGFVTETRFNRVGDFDKDAKSPEEKERVFKQHGWMWGSRFIDFDLDDGIDHIRLRINPAIYDKYGDMIRNGSALMVRGVFQRRQGPQGTAGGIGMVTGIELIDSLKKNEVSTPYGEAVLSRRYHAELPGMTKVAEMEDWGECYGTLIGIARFLRKKDDAPYAVLTFQNGNKSRDAVLWADDFEKFGHLLELEDIYKLSVRYGDTDFFGTHLSVKRLQRIKLKMKAA